MPNTPRKNTINVLHLSDIHFGAEPTDKVTNTQVAQRNNTLNSLMATLRQVPDDWKPDIIAVSGDVGWKGSKSDYKAAHAWLNDVLKLFSLTSDCLITCAGNHDINRRATMGMSPPANPDEADAWLGLENIIEIDNFTKPFADYMNFCQEAGMPELAIGDVSSPLVGQREIKGLRFVVLNSAWFCRGDADNQQLWLGLPQLQVLVASKQLVSPEQYDSDLITIALVHHPNTWLNESERNAYNERPNTYRYLCDRSHLILSGHVHGAVERPSRMYNRAYVFNGGATYAGGNYRNNFSILQIDTSARTFRKLAFEFDPRDETWQFKDDPSPYSMVLHTDTSRPQLVPEGSNAHYPYAALAQKALSFAKRYVDQKSRAIARTHGLPTLIRRSVAVHNYQERAGVTAEGKIWLDTGKSQATFEDLVSTERPCFLFGELGSGKSTLVGEYVACLSTCVEGLVPLLLPAKCFAGKPLPTIEILADLLSRYVSEHVAPSLGAFRLNDALRRKLEVCLVVDGLDELERPQARTLLARLAELQGEWAGLRVIATGRPVELEGFDYSQWQCLHMLPLTASEQEQLLVNEALTEGKEAKQASADAKDRLHVLRKRPELLSIANTPLTVRLLRPHLTEEITSKSLGDLLYDVLQERLGEWGAWEGKDESIQDFASQFPTTLSREGILARIATAVHDATSKSITREMLLAILTEEVPELPNKHAVVAQGSHFFEAAVLQREQENSFVFPSQPLLQCALGCHISQRLLSGEILDTKDLDRQLWREYSFAACIARRKGMIGRVRKAFGEYITALIAGRALSPAAATIVSEARDAELAVQCVRELQRTVFRSIKWFSGQEAQSAAAFAHTIRLAGKEGFNWFFGEYLDPRYPAEHALSNIATEVFRYWLNYSQFELSATEATQLAELVEPHMTAHSWECYQLMPLLAMALPDRFAGDQRLLLYVQSLSSIMTRTRATGLLRQAYEAGLEEPVLRALELAASRSDERSEIAADLWLDLCRECPPPEIVRAIIAGVASREVEIWTLNTLEERLGADRLEAALRWYACGRNKLACAAALLLHKRGERNLHVLGPGLAYGVHDGVRIEGAETALRGLVRAYGPEGASWLVERFPLDEPHGGASSAFWRILLDELLQAEEAHPALLSHAIRSLDQYILARYPEVRRALFLLLTEKPAYRETLRQLVGSFSNRTRFCAACILLACFPDEEEVAAEVAVLGAVDNFAFSEFFSFCLRLKLGARVMDRIHAQIAKLIGRSKTFALCLLHHNAYPLLEEEYSTLVRGLLEKGSGLEIAWQPGDGKIEATLAEPRAYSMLRQALEHGGETAENAAAALLDFHRQRLTPEQDAACWAAAVTKIDFWNLSKLDAETERLHSEPEFQTLVCAASRNIQKTTHQEPIAGIYGRTFTDVSAWKDLLWASLFRHEHFGSLHDGGAVLWMYGKARNSPTIATILGGAAVEFLQNEGITEDRCSHDAVLWLTFLAHEFGGLPVESVSKALLRYQSVHPSVVTALLARVGHVPVGFIPPSPGHNLVFARLNSARSDEAVSYDRLLEVCRDASGPHPQAGQWLERVLLSGALTEEELDDLALASKFGGMFAALVGFYRQKYVDDDRIIAAMDFNTLQWRGDDELAVVLWQCFRALVRSVIDDPGRSERYFQRLAHWIYEKAHANVTMLCEQFLHHSRQVPVPILSTLFEEIVSRRYLLTFRLAEQLAHYFLAVREEENRFQVLDEVTKVVGILIVHWEDYPSDQSSLCQMLFALASFVLGDTPTAEGQRLFLLGLQGMLIQPREQHPRAHDRETRFLARDVMQVLQPLFEAVQPSTIQQCVGIGMSADLPEIKVCCRVLAALAGCLPE